MNTQIADTLKNLSAAEEFFEFLGVAYSPQVVQVNRLHILKRFQQYLSMTPVPDDLPDERQRAIYGQHLDRAYQDFVRSSPATEKVFKVFQDAAGTYTVSVGKLKASLRERDS